MVINFSVAVMLVLVVFEGVNVYTAATTAVATTAAVIIIIIINIIIIIIIDATKGVCV